MLGFRADTNETRKVDEMLAHKKAGSREQGSGADAVGVEGVSPSSDVGTTTDTRSVVKLSGASRSCNGLSLGVSAGVDNSLAGGVVGSGGISPISVSELAQKVSALAADVVSVFSKREDKGQTPVR